MAQPTSQPRCDRQERVHLGVIQVSLSQPGEPAIRQQSRLTGQETQTPRSQGTCLGLTAGKRQNRDPISAGRDRAVGWRVYVCSLLKPLAPHYSGAETCSQQGSQCATSW